ncbi:Ku protein (plasmid) [Streptomyces sp. NBC_01205]|nr:Ku protein [Streptomyces sp. NBC_01205]
MGRGYETAAGVVGVTDADLDALPLTTARSIDLVAFVPASTIDPLQVGSAYYLSPDGPTALKPYTLLKMALERSSKVAITKYSMRDRERLGALRVVGDVIALYQLRWPDEIRPASAVPAPAKVDVSEDEIVAAVELASALSVGFDLSQQRDRYREALEAVIAAKALGTRPEPAEEAAPVGQVVDLMAALLQQSVQDARAARGEDIEATIHDLPSCATSREFPRALLSPCPCGQGVLSPWGVLRAGDVTSGFVMRSHFVRSICDRGEGEEARVGAGSRTRPARVPRSGLG